MITCKECGREFLIVTNSHLRTHNMTTKDYLDKFPETELVSTEAYSTILDTRGYTIRPQCAREGCANTVKERQKKYCSRRCFFMVQLQKETDKCGQ